MTAAPQGTLIQIFVELSKWGVGEPLSWSVSRQVARRWLVVGRQRSGLQDLSPKGLQALDGALGVISQEKDAGGRWDCGLAVAAWKLEVSSSLQLVVVGMGQLPARLCQRL